MNTAQFDRRMLDGLICPISQGTLSFDAEKQELVSKSAKVAFLTQEQVPNSPRKKHV